MILKRNPVFYNKGLLTNLGTSANVYKLSGVDGGNYVGRVIKDNYSFGLKSDDFWLEKEFAFASNLFLEGVSTPKPEGIFSILINNPFPVKRNAYISKYIEGIDFWDYCYGRSFDFLKRAQELFSLEINKVKKMGYIPGDHCNNAIYSPKEDKVYIFDFEEWKYFGDYKNLKKFN